VSFPQLILIFAGFLTTALGSYFIKTQLDGLLPYGRPGIVLLFVGLFSCSRAFSRSQGSAVRMRRNFKLKPGKRMLLSSS
jgi:hypothetical protein